MNLKKPKVLILSGPNLNMLGKREVSIYGADTLESLHLYLEQVANDLGVEIHCSQHNSESKLVEWLEIAKEKFDGIVINAGAYTHYSEAVGAATLACGLPCIEVHMSNVYKREKFRHTSVLAPVCVGCIVGFGRESYAMGLTAMSKILREA